MQCACLDVKSQGADQNRAAGEDHLIICFSKFMRKDTYGLQLTKALSVEQVRAALLGGTSQSLSEFNYADLK